MSGRGFGLTKDEMVMNTNTTYTIGIDDDYIAIH